MKEDAELTGLGGWLILLGLGIVVAPVRIILHSSIYLEIFTNNTWYLLNTEGLSTYIPYWGIFFWVEVLVNAILLLGWIGIGYLFFNKRRVFIKAYIIITLLTLIFLSTDIAMSQLLMPNVPAFDDATIEQLVRLIIACTIWIPYLRYSRRVKLTFIN